MQDSICGGQPVQVNYNGPAGLDLFWDFSTNDFENTPTGQNYGNLGNPNFPHDLKAVKDGNNHYVFMANLLSGSLTRYDFGNSFNNQPTSFNYGNVGGLLGQPSGFDIIIENGIWYAIVISFNNSKLIRLNFGSDISLNNATATDLGNISTISGPRSLKIIKDVSGDYFVFIPGAGSANLSKIEFGNSITNNAGAISSISNPAFTGAWGFDIAFDCNSGNFVGYSSSNPNSTFTQIDFGNSLSNVGAVTTTFPSPKITPRGVSLLRNGGDWFLISMSATTNSVMVLSFGNDLLNTSPDLIYADTVNSSLNGPALISLIADSSKIFGFVSNLGNATLSMINWPPDMLATPQFNYNNLSPTFTPLSSGYYPITLQGTDQTTGDIGYYTDSIYVNPSPLPAFSNTPPCEGDSIFFTDQTTIQGGTISSWIWDFGDATPVSNDQNPSHVYAAPGSYLITQTVTSTNGCQNINSDSIFISQLPIADYTFIDDQCTGSSVDFTDNSFSPGSTPIVAWVWDFGDGTPSDSIQNTVHVFDSSGVYNVTLTTYLQNGCNSTIIKQVNIIPSPQCDFTVLNTCQGQTAMFMNGSTISGGITLSYQWDFGDTNSSIATDPTHNYAATPANYDVTLIANASNGCNDTIVNNIRVSSQPVPAFSFTPTVACAGNNVVFSNSSIGIGIDTVLSYNWAFGDGGLSSDEDPVYMYTTPGTYNITLSVSTPTSCDSTISQQITIIPGPTCSFNANNECVYNEVLFNPATFTPTGTVIDSVVWDFGDNNTFTGLSNPTHLYSTPGTYAVTMTLYNNVNCTDTYIDSVTVHPKPSAQFMNTLPCSGSDILFDGSISNGNGNIITSWLWDFNGNGSSTDTMPVFSFADSGSYNVTLIVSTQNGCTDTLVNNLTVIQSPDFDFIFDDPCFGDATIFSYVPNQTPPPPSNLLWDFGDNSTSSQLTPTHLYTLVDTFNVSLTVLNPNTGCSKIVEKPLFVKPVPSAGFIAPDGCAESTVQFTDTTLIEFGSITTWQWDFGNNTIDSVQNPSLVYSNAGIYNINLLAVSDLGCAAAASNTIEVFEKPVADFLPDPLFGSPPLTVTFINNTTGGSNYTWEFGDNSSGAGPNPSHIYSDTGTYMVTMIASSVEGCLDTAYNIVGVLVPYIDLAVNDISISKSNTLVSLSSTVTNQGNITVQSFEIQGLIEKNTPINELWTGILNPGESIIYKFDARFIVDQNFLPTYYCVETSKPNTSTDQNPGNNNMCATTKSDFSILNITPNPFNENLNLNLNFSNAGTFDIRVYDITGKVVLSTEQTETSSGFKTMTLDTRTLSKGIYAVTVDFNGQQSVVKALKK